MSLPPCHPHLHELHTELSRAQSGWLWRQQPHMPRAFKRRWFVLRAGELKGYKEACPPPLPSPLPCVSTHTGLFVRRLSLMPWLVGNHFLFLPRRAHTVLVLQATCLDSQESESFTTDASESASGKGTHDTHSATARWALLRGETRSTAPVRVVPVCPHALQVPHDYHYLPSFAVL